MHAHTLLFHVSLTIITTVIRISTTIHRLTQQILSKCQIVIIYVQYMYMNKLCYMQIMTSLFRIQIITIM